MEWTESIVVERPLATVQAAIADEHQLMEWSAWQQATGYRCDVDGDGRSIGSTIVFRDSAGIEQGHQRLTHVEADRVEYRLRNRGPRGQVMTPEVDFRLEALGGTRTRVHLDFRATVPLPPGAPDCRTAARTPGPPPARPGSEAAQSPRRERDGADRLTR